MTRNYGESADRIRADLLAGNDRHVARLDPSALDAVREAQHPPVVSVCCSDSRVPQDGMWDVSEPGRLFTVANIGNRATTRVDGERVLDGGVAYPTLYTDTEVVAVVGHTGCGAVTAAYDVARGETGRDELPPGVRADLDPLIETVVDAPVALDGEKRAVVDRLVEYNVREQVSFVAGETDAAVYGFVYDIHRRYGDEDGRAYLVAAGDGDPGDVVGDGNGMAVESVL